MKGKIYLIPNTLGGENPNDVIPTGVLEILRDLDHFIVENEKSARRFLIKCGYQKPIDDLSFFVLNKHTSKEEINTFLHPCLNGQDMGIISEAGVPGVADPGSDIVAMAHKAKITVVPLSGPSSIILALMASGMNGQHFCFHGYLPVKPHERKSKIRQLEAEAKRTGFTQIFIETPYRNNAVFESLKETCRPDTSLCIACDITMPTEFIKTLTIREWKKERVDLKKRPSIFLLS
ncbi:MAG: SAM-dependent methyltransferase [Bacteroidota bacterium]